ncbi:F0F1 ATP synthase subunit B [Natronospora cellulosivora (SeqCode)]
MMDINWMTFFFTVVNFLLILWLLKKYLYGPITNILDQRSDKIQGDLKTAEEQKKEAMALKRKYEQEIAQARSKAQEIIDEAEDRAKERAEEILAEAKKDAVRVRERNEDEIARAKEEALNQLRQEVASISLMAAAKFMQEKLQDKQHEKLMEEYIKNLDHAKLGEIK